MTDNKYKQELNIGFWRKETGNIMSHGKGLTKEQVEFIQALKEGDRLILWSNNPKPGEDTKPTHSLKIFLNKEQRAKVDQDF